MTVSAVFVVESIPCLIADTMVSQPGEQNPLRSYDLNDKGVSRLAKRGRSISHAIRKIAILTPNFAISFAGSVSIAADIIRKLRTYCDDGPPTFDDLQDYLGTLEACSDQNQRVDLVGWLGVQGTFRAFEWSNASPRELNYNTGPFVIGSGALPFIKTVGHLLTSPSDPPAIPEVHLAVMLGACLRTELIEGFFSEVSTGIWFEAVCFDHKRGLNTLAPYYFIG